MEKKNFKNLEVLNKLNSMKQDLERLIKLATILEYNNTDLPTECVTEVEIRVNDASSDITKALAAVRKGYTGK